MNSATHESRDKSGSSNESTVFVRLYRERRLVFSSTISGEIELGRQRAKEPGPYRLVPKAAGRRSRLIIADNQQSEISRRHALLKVRDCRCIEVRNLSRFSSIGVHKADAIPAGEERQITLPAFLTVGDHTIGIDGSDTARHHELDLESLATPTVAPGPIPAAGDERVDALWSRLGAMDPTSTNDSDIVLRGLRATIGVLERAASAPDFLPLAAQAVLDTINLDSVAVLRYGDGDWEIAAYRNSSGGVESKGWQPSTTMLQQVLNERRTFRAAPRLSASLQKITALVAAPILDDQGRVIGVLYGDRLHAGDAISEVEATLVEVMAASVAAGLARLEQEQTAIAARVRFEEFFSPQLGRQLECDPDLLQGRDAEISVLFCDIRRFSSISERLGPGITVAWISDVMGVLSDCVIEHGGVLVDYIGDELMAMWGAPIQQPDHARRCCRAALEIVAKIKPLNQRWRTQLGAPFDLGLGINSGVTRVGNVGSHRKFKYGPLGHTVNLASRVRGATKQIGKRLLITAETARQLDAGSFMRRICKARLIGLDRPTDLFELESSPSPTWLEVRAAYEAALEAFEEREFSIAIQHLADILRQTPDDGPSVQLLLRAVQEIPQENATFDGVWDFASK